VSTPHADAEVADVGPYPARAPAPRPASRTSVAAALRREARLLVRYLTAGLASFGVDVAVFAALVAGTGMDPLVAHLLSRPLGGLTCFFLHRTWTFASTGPVAGPFARFVGVFGASFLLTAALLALFHRGFGMPAVPGKVLAEAIAVLFNFLALRHFTFRPSEP
jgi:putative flippase GtrA